MDNFIQITVICSAKPRVGALFTGTRGRSINSIFLLLFSFLPKEKAKNNEGKGLIDLTEIQETRDMQ